MTNSWFYSLPIPRVSFVAEPISESFSEDAQFAYYVVAGFAVLVCLAFYALHVIADILIDVSATSNGEKWYSPAKLRHDIMTPIAPVTTGLGLALAYGLYGAGFLQTSVADSSIEAYSPSVYLVVFGCVMLLCYDFLHHYSNLAERRIRTCLVFQCLVFASYLAVIYNAENTSLFDRRVVGHFALICLVLSAAIVFVRYLLNLWEIAQSADHDFETITKKALTKSAIITALGYLLFGVYECLLLLALWSQYVERPLDAQMWITTEVNIALFTVAFYTVYLILFNGVFTYLTVLMDTVPKIKSFTRDIHAKISQTAV